MNKMKKSKRMKTQTLVLCALLMAMHVVLSYLSIDLPFMKINLSPLPIIIGGMMFGPVIGGMVGLLGSLLYQMLKFGIDPTTVLWIVPVGVRGLLVGLYAKTRKFHVNKVEMVILIVVTSIIATVLNTIFLYITGYVNKEESVWFIFGSRILNSLLMSVVCSIIIIPLMKPLRKYFHMAEK